MWSSVRRKSSLTYVVYFVKSKIGPTESCDTSYSYHWKVDNQGWGRKLIHTNSMECDEQTTYVLCKRMALNATPYFPWIPLGYWRLETMELSITSLFFSVLAYGQASFFLLYRSMPPFSKGFWGDLRDMTGVFILKGLICG